MIVICCKYCFAGTGDFGGKRELMSLEVGKKRSTFNRWLCNRKQLEVDFLVENR